MSDTNDDGIDALDGAALDAAVAELMGYRRGNARRGEHAWFAPGGENTPVIPRYSSRADHDYEVLEYVRTNWTPDRVESFALNLALLHESRVDPNGTMADSQCARDVMYQPGDYSRAALKAARALRHEAGGTREVRR